MSEVVVLFDLDGTLVDPREGITRCIQYALERMGVVPPPAADLERCIGPPLRESLAELLGYPGDDSVEEALRLYRERYEPTGLYENALYPGVVAMLERIRAKEWPAYVATSKPTVYARRIVEHFSLGTFFVQVYGSALSGELSRKEDLIRHVLQAELIAPADAVMVGDRRHDVLGALANGVAAIGVTYGYGGREELLAAGAGRVCDDPLAVVDALVAMARPGRGTGGG